MLDLHRRTMQRSIGIVDAVRDDQWEQPTPCAGWTLRDLLHHMIRENRGFAAAASGETADRSPWTSPVGSDLRAAYAASAGHVVAAFAAADVSVGTFWLPLIDDTRTFPAAQAIGFHLLDYLVHGWDVAVATGQPTDAPDDLVAAVWAVAVRDVPDGPRRHRPGASFAPPVPVSPDAPLADRLLAHLGRDPYWRP